MARAIDAEWVRCGRPDPWIVIEAGAGAGALAAGVLAAAPTCAPALRYLAVETSAELRRAAAARLPLEDPAQFLGPHAPPDEGDEPPVAMPGQGPIVTTLGELPAGPIDGMVIANELLDNLAFDVYERTRAGWTEIRVGMSASGSMVELAVEADEGVATRLDRLAPDAPIGSRVPWQASAREWVRRATGVVRQGAVICVDYGRSTAELATAGAASWMRTYRAGGRGVDPLAQLGAQDITADVAWDQLDAGTGLPLRSSQREWLVRHGIEDLRQQAAEHWHAQAAVGDLAALRARSRVNEAEALCDPNGLGGFMVLEWKPLNPAK
jgi:SAM-dependent MidA family methyltransferase